MGAPSPSQPHMPPFLLVAFPLCQRTGMIAAGALKARKATGYCLQFSALAAEVAPHSAIAATIVLGDISTLIKDPADFIRREAARAGGSIGTPPPRIRCPDPYAR